MTKMQLQSLGDLVATLKLLWTQACPLKFWQKKKMSDAACSCSFVLMVKLMQIEAAEVLQCE